MRYYKLVFKVTVLWPDKKNKLKQAIINHCH